MPRYIDADALKCRFEGYPYDFYDYDELIHLIDEQPTISPDEVRGVGKWLHTSDEFGTYEKCSCCGKEYYCGPIAPFNYCPSCGAKMEASEDA